LGGLWALEWAWQSTETVYSSIKTVGELALRKKLRNLHAKSQ